MKQLALLLLGSLLLSACHTQKKISKQDYMNEVYAEIKGNVSEAEVQILNDTVKVLFPEHLLFKIGESEVLKNTYPLLKRFAGALNAYPKTSILINGYTDTTGSATFNNNLSRERAINTKSILNSFEVNAERIYTWGRGSKDPIADNNSFEGRRKNRRVEFIILYSYNPDPE